ncbi:MAG: glycerol-3-phosphate responsive antiterminator [Acidobacteria bacterium]|nr:glycerol-3-phosphate responsive antiterminator [Acidobacteriota bacterium]
MQARSATMEGKSSRLGFYCTAEMGTNPSTSIEFVSNPVIASVTTPEAFEIALLAPTRSLCILTGNPLTLPGLLKRAHDCGKLCAVNIDFLDGLSRDRFAIEFLAAHGVAGVVSTRTETLKAAQALGLMTILRTFAIDTAAVMAAKKSLAQFRPDAVEVLPAMAAPRVSKYLKEVYPGMTTIGGGLIETVREIEDLLHAGIKAITTSNTRLWLI